MGRTFQLDFLRIFSIQHAGNVTDDASTARATYYKKATLVRPNCLLIPYFMNGSGGLDNDEVVPLFVEGVWYILGYISRIVCIHRPIHTETAAISLNYRVNTKNHVRQ